MSDIAFLLPEFMNKLLNDLESNRKDGILKCI